MIQVAVIARPRSPTLGTCVAALRAAGCAAPHVVEIGSDGPAQARNAALHACHHRILALVEDDVIVARGWLDAVAGAWRDPRTAIAGGPLSGSEPRIAAASPTYPGGNVAFRAAALRGAGGFWPARGNADARDWFSEEHEAQRELLRMGWTSAYVPAMAARRAGAEPSLAQRMKAGARRQAVGEPRSSARAARAVATGLGGAALGRRRERLGRVAENVGVLLGPRLVQRELEPVATETPFRASIPRPARGRRRARGAGGPPAVLVYHRIADLEDDPMGLAVRPAHWAEQLEVLRSREIAPLQDLVDGRAGPGALAVTFDDGYADNLVLRDAGIPVTLFVTTGHVEEGRSFWWDRVTAACRARAGEVVTVEDRAFVLGDVARWHLAAWLQARAPQDIDRVLDALAAPEGDRPLTVEELRGLAEHVAIGAHTRTHRSLRHATAEQQRDEVRRSRDDLARWLGTTPTAFAYPFGVPGEAFDEMSKAVVREAGFSLAVQNAAAPASDRFAVPRRAVPDVDGERFTRWLDGS